MINIFLKKLYKCANNFIENIKQFFIIFYFIKYILFYRAKEHYKNNRDVILNRSKEYYINNKESILQHLKNKYQPLIEDKKQKIKDYQKEYQKEYKENMSNEQKQKLKGYRKEYYKKYYAEKKVNN